MKKIGLNDMIKVKLTPFGANIYYHQYDDINKKIELAKGKPLELRMPQIDKDGFTEFQLWDFISLYGEHIGLGKPDVISDMNIYISDEDLEEVKTE